MLNDAGSPSGRPADVEEEAPVADPSDQSADNTASADFDESMLDEVGALIDDARVYATAELAFQKTRAKLAGRSVAIAAGSVILAIILLHISLIALAVGFVIALAPLVTIWGAIAIVVGIMLLLVGLLGWSAMRHGQRIGAMFEGAKDSEAEQ